MQQLSRVAEAPHLIPWPYAKHCKEPTAEEVRKKDEANFCDHFKPKAGA
jgi:RIO-like serine/threonine protein kinase